MEGKEIRLLVNKDGLVEVCPEPYAVLEFETEADYTQLQAILRIYRGLGKLFKEGHRFTSQKGEVSFGSYDELKKIADAIPTEEDDK